MVYDDVTAVRVGTKDYLVHILQERNTNDDVLMDEQRRTVHRAGAACQLV